MMELVLTVLRCPDAVAPETRVLKGGELSAGRGPGVDWELPDPERVVSKVHFTVFQERADWRIKDLSANGTFLNKEAEPIGLNAVRTLRDGDRLRAGPYEIEVGLNEEVGLTSQSWTRKEDFGAFGLPLSPPPAGEPDPLASARPSSVLSHALPGLGPLPAGWETDFVDSETTGAAPAPAGASPVRSAAPPPVPPPARPPTPPPPPAAPLPSRAAAENGPELLQALFEGAGLADIRSKDPAGLMRELGAAFRALVTGLRAALIARASIKGDFRIERTIIRVRGNNPLKFAAGDDDALAALLGGGRRSDMRPEEAVADALRDLRLHELATVAAMQSAIRALLDQLDPARVRAAVEPGGRALLPGQRKARAWDAYEELYQKTVRALSDDFDSVFGKAFARAYERVLAEIAQDREP